MALNQYGLGILLTAKDMASATFKSFGGHVEKLEGSLEELGKSFKAVKATMIASSATIGAGVAGLVFSTKAANSFGEFEYALARAGAISQASAADMKLMEDAAIQAGISTKFTSTESADALAEFAAQGFNAREQTEALVPALDLAAGGSIGVADAALAMTSALKVFGLQTEDASLAADKLLKISNLTSLQARDLQLALGTVGRGASATKQSLDEMLISMGFVKNTGVDASVAASSVSSALIYMAKSADKFSKIGVSVTDAAGKFRPFMDIAMDTQAALSGVTNEAERTAQAQELFGRFGITAFQAISTQLETGIRTVTGEVLKGTDALDYMRKTMAGAAGTAEEMRNRLLATWQGQSDILKGVLETAFNEVGRPFAEIMRPIVSAVADFFAGLTKTLKNIPAPIKRVVAGLVVFGSVLLVVGGAAVLATAVMAAFGTAIGAAVVAMIEAAIVVAPLIAAIAGIGLVVAAVVTAIQNNVGGMGDKLKHGFEQIRIGFESVVGFLTEGKLSGPLAEEFLNADQSTQDFVVGAVLFFEKMKAGWDGFVSAFEEGINASLPFIEAMLDEFAKLGDALGLNLDFMKNAKTPMEKFAGVGRMIGSAFVFVADVFMFLITVATRVVRVFSELVGLVYNLGMALMALSADDFGGFLEYGKKALTNVGGVLGAIGGDAIVSALSDENKGPTVIGTRGMPGVSAEALAASGNASTQAVFTAAAEAGYSPPVDISPETAERLGLVVAQAVAKQPLQVSVQASISPEELYSSNANMSREEAAYSFSSMAPTE